MKPGNLRLQGAKSGGANREMRRFCVEALRRWGVFYFGKRYLYG